MLSRPLEIAAFLDQNRWGNAEAHGFDADFSPRRYARLTGPGNSTAILMDADSDQKTPQFVAIAGYLRGKGIAVPEIYAASPDRGLVLMQDFGTGNVGSLIDQGADAKPFLLRAAEILARLHKNAAQDSSALNLPSFTTDLFTTQAELFLDAYIPFASKRDATKKERSEFRDAWRAVLRPLENLPQRILLRDFMPDNLMDLQGNTIGVLDFQDAGIGPIAYDLASLCEEVRRDGGFSHLPAVIAHYIAASQSPLSAADLLRACTILSAQRHIRILGILAQQASLGRRDKLDFIPRIRQHLKTILAEPYLSPLRDIFESAHS